MKEVLKAIVVLLCMAISPVFAQTAEEMAVLNVARSETEAYLKNDSATWRTFFIQDEKTNTLFSGRFFYVPTKGWRAVAAQIQGWMKERGKPSRYNKVTISNAIFHLSDHMATMVYDQSLSSDKVDTLPSTFSREYRTLVKDNEQWKIASMTTIDTVTYRSDKPQDIEDEINVIGYKFLFSKKVDQAIEIFKLNVKMNPQAWNPYDSLGEAYAAAGNTKLAIKNYERSVQLNPNNDNGKKILQKLKAGGKNSASSQQNASK